MCNPVYFDELGDLGISTIAIMVDSSKAVWDPRWTADEVDSVCKLAIERDIEVVLTCWPVPNMAIINAMLDGIAPMIDYGVAGVEFDLEGLWKQPRVVGFDDLEAAGIHLVDATRELTAPLDVRLEVTSHNGHRETGKSAHVSPYADRLNTQVYSVRHRNGMTVGWEHPNGPGAIQRRGIVRAHGVRGLDAGGPRLGVGLAIWDQRWPGHRPEAALRIAYDASIEYSPGEIRLWSSKWLLGAKRQGWVADAIKSIH